MVTGLSHVFLLVSDLARSVKFYRQLLERVPVSEDGRHARFELGKVSLNIHKDLSPGEVLAGQLTQYLSDAAGVSISPFQQMILSARTKSWWGSGPRF